MVEINKDSFPSLSPKSIHLWWDEFQAIQTTASQWAILDSEEQSRAQRFKRDCDRDRYVRVRSALRQLIAGYLNISAADVRFCYGCKGKPRLDSFHHDENLEFNVSHSHNFVMWGFSRDHALGVDVEYIKPEFQAEQIAQRFFTEDEFQAFKDQPEVQQRLFFFQLWTRKEACIKARGDSLFEQISQFAVPCHEPCSSGWSSLKNDTLSVRDLDLHQNYTAAIATFSDDSQLSCFKFDLNPAERVDGSSPLGNDKDRC